MRGAGGKEEVHIEEARGLEMFPVVSIFLVCYDRYEEH